MGPGEDSMSFKKLKSTPRASFNVITVIGDLVAVVGDVEQETFGFGVVVEAGPRTSMVRWTDGDLVRMKNTALDVIAEGSKSVVKTAQVKSSES